MKLKLLIGTIAVLLLSACTGLQPLAPMDSAIDGPPIQQTVPNPLSSWQPSMKSCRWIRLSAPASLTMA
jgi:hypothetical protein